MNSHTFSQSPRKQGKSHHHYHGCSNNGHCLCGWVQRMQILMSSLLKIQSWSKCSFAHLICCQEFYHINFHLPGSFTSFFSSPPDCCSWCCFLCVDTWNKTDHPAHCHKWLMHIPMLEAFLVFITWWVKRIVQTDRAHPSPGRTRGHWVHCGTLSPIWP